MSDHDSGELPVGTLVLVEVRQHAPFGLTVGLVEPDYPGVATVNLPHISDDQRPPPMDTWPAVGTRHSAVVWVFEGGHRRLTLQPSAVAKARTNWGVRLFATISLVSIEAATPPAPLRPESSTFSIRSEASSGLAFSRSRAARLEIADHAGLSPGDREVPVTLRFWDESAESEFPVGSRFEVVYRDRSIATGVITQGA